MSRSMTEELERIKRSDITGNELAQAALSIASIEACRQVFADQPEKLKTILSVTARRQAEIGLLDYEKHGTATALYTLARAAMACHDAHRADFDPLDVWKDVLGEELFDMLEAQMQRHLRLACDYLTLESGNRATAVSTLAERYAGTRFESFITKLEAQCSKNCSD